ncbi:flavin-containing monooxygenase [Shewanella surugensis]|uniref:NAD(P)/FAD-dependent oxidoreductase n=1 Tax=Shewanella surugensis TaxID=212020 RepID=A0ABT0L8M7_9GAMM|nr:NAD(P)/FAD-dependent oxidoreductase [Shewanella surugensis]MCL1124052.1 NAD(P)/FAD-dependent oxidoreductase [Shewanella surugensis]
MQVNKRTPSVAIIGAGMTGIMLAIKLCKMGIKKITIIEKKEQPGGTWRENTYPGVACDVPSHMYCYSFAPNPNWSHLFAPGKEILAYFNRVFIEYELAQYTRFNETVTQCIYKDSQWHITTNTEHNLTVDFLFSATGILHQPMLPNISGKEVFSGISMHSAQWDHEVSLTGKKIGVIGTGSSAAQLIPELIKQNNTQVTVFQRTPAWMLGIKNKPYNEQQKQHYRNHPLRTKIVNKILLYLCAKLTTALTKNSFIHKKIIQFFTHQSISYVKKTIQDKKLQKKLIPTYTLGCKRLVINATYYDALNKPNATLETQPIETVVHQGIRTQDGQIHKLDVIIYATGFNPFAYMHPMTLIGRNGVNIEDVWNKKIQAYRSLCIPNFPNFFLMLGPHSPIANYSMIEISEKQANWAINLIKSWQHHKLDIIEAKPEAMKVWCEMLNKKKHNTVWASGCQSWYLDKDGDPITWPDTWTNWVALMRQPNLKDFR